MSRTLKSYSWMVLLIGILSAVPTHAGSMQIFTNRASFEASVSGISLFETFDSFTPINTPLPAVVSFDGVFTAAASGGLFALPNEKNSSDIFLSTELNLRSITLTFSGGAYAVGGEFFTTSGTGSPFNNFMTATLGDGTSATIATVGDDLTTGFLGFNTGDENTFITSLTVSTSAQDAGTYVTMNNLETASVPEPATLLLLGSGLIVGARSIRKKV